MKNNKSLPEVCQKALSNLIADRGYLKQAVVLEVSLMKEIVLKSC